MLYFESGSSCVYVSQIGQAVCEHADVLLEEILLVLECYIQYYEEHSQDQPIRFTGSIRQARTQLDAHQLIYNRGQETFQDSIELPKGL